MHLFRRLWRSHPPRHDNVNDLTELSPPMEEAQATSDRLISQLISGKPSPSPRQGDISHHEQTVRMSKVRLILGQLSQFKRQSLTVKLAVSMTGVILAAIGSITALSIRREQAAFKIELQQRANVLLDTLEVTTVEGSRALSHSSSVGDLSRLMNALKDENSLITGSYIFDAEGKTIDNLQRSERSPSGSASTVGPTGGSIFPQNGETLFEWSETHLYAGRSISNHPQIGAISLELSTAQLDTNLGRVWQRGVAIALCSTSLGATLAVIVSRSVTKPLRTITEATRRIANGHLDESVSVPPDSECAALASAFNAMTQKLRCSVTERDQVETALRESRERYALAVKGANDGLWDWNLKTSKIYFSPRWKEMLGYSETDLDETPRVWFDRVHPDDLDTLKSAIAAHLQGITGQLKVEYRMQHQEGHYLWMLSRGVVVRDKSDAPYRMSGSQTDITLQKETENQLFQAAFHDPLTGLPNRAMLLKRLETLLRRSHNTPDYMFAVLFLDFDRFKVVNDSLGHNIGDQLLVEITQRLRQSLRRSDIVARLGGDEFIMLIEGIYDITSVMDLAERIQQKLKIPFSIQGHDIVSTASIGIVACDSNYKHAEEVLRDADICMYRAKEAGRDQYIVFHPDMHTGTLDRLKSESDLRNALKRQEFALNYQPIVKLATGEFVGFEALIRWHHPDKGWVSPGEFIPLAEETGLIVPIGAWTLGRACIQVRQWNLSFSQETPFSISVNLSSNQIAQPDLIDQVRQTLEQSQLSASQLKIEITESVIMKNLDVACSKLQALRDMGIQIYIDDFGTGYSSLGYLQKLPIDVLKIDRSFVRNIGVDGGSEEIIRAIMMLANGLGKTVIAEGIETLEQQHWLNQLGCQFAQGYLFSRPLDPDNAETFISRFFDPYNINSSYTDILDHMLPHQSSDALF